MLDKILSLNTFKQIENALSHSENVKPNTKLARIYIKSMRECLLYLKTEDLDSVASTVSIFIDAIEEFVTQVENEENSLDPNRVKEGDLARGAAPKVPLDGEYSSKIS